MSARIMNSEEILRVAMDGGEKAISRKIQPPGTEDSISESDYVEMLKYGYTRHGNSVSYLSSTAASIQAQHAMMARERYLADVKMGLGNAAALMGLGSAAALISPSGTWDDYNQQRGRPGATFLVQPPMQPAKKNYERGSLHASLSAEIEDWCGGILKR